MQNIDEFMIKAGELTDVIRLYASIIEEFPEGERKGMEVFIRLYETREYKLLLAFNESGIEVGYAFIYTVRKLNKLWLDFIVIYPEFQGKGYGTKFFNKMARYFIDYDGIFLEVEIPQGLNQNQDRRILFYERMGAIRFDMKYYLPNEFGGLEMFLFYKPFHESKALAAKEIISVIESAYDFIHSDIPDKDQWLSQTKKSQDGNL